MAATVAAATPAAAYLPRFGRPSALCAAAAAGTGAGAGARGVQHQQLTRGLASAFWSRPGRIRQGGRRIYRDGGPGLCSSGKFRCSSAAAGSADNQSDESPYQVLGVSPFENFDSIKDAYKRRHRDAEKRGDEAAMTRFEGAYDKLLMMQLKNRKKGRTFGDFEVSKEIKYADKRAWFPWAPRSATSPRNDILINGAVSAVIVIWMYVSKEADWKPLQFLLFGYAWRIFMKLAEFEPPTSFSSEDDEDQTSKRRQRSGKRLLRTLGFVFGSVTIASLLFTGILNGYELLGLYIPRKIINSQELFVTIVSSVLLFFGGSYYR